MSLPTSASRPGPLCEWSLDRFLPSNSNATQDKLSGNSRPNKRPLSPGGPSLFSPTKRRILTQEGIFLPEKMMKSPFRERRTAGPSFGDLLRAPGSPVKKLDFERTRSPQLPSSILEGRDVVGGSVKATPVKVSAASLELVPKTNAKSTHRTFDDDDFFATPERLTTSLSRPTAPTPFTLLPREIPPPTDPQSIHYPGFMVYQDPHIHIPVVNPAILQSFAQDSKDCDEWKENVALRRKIKKANSDPVDGKITLHTPEAKKPEVEKLFKAKATPATPRKTEAKERQEVTSPTPRRASLRHKTGTPVTPDEKRQRRQMLKDEVDEADGMDEEDIQGW
ncbi:hypothetical protein GGU11DRAFT_527389 [Lentinula aff. detonsa]|nr:hypothetical protein GGU11DRAFT_527389 [Lentinula aff. detonsa]